MIRNLKVENLERQLIIQTIIIIESKCRNDFISSFQFSRLRNGTDSQLEGFQLGYT